MRRGHIYILINGCMPGLVKIGHTWQSPKREAEALSQAAGVPLPFTLVWDEELIHCDEADQLIQTRLEKHRFHGNTEFFALPLKDAIQAVKQVASEFHERERLERGGDNAEVPPVEMKKLSVQLDDGKPVPLPPAAANAKALIRRQVLVRIGVGLFLGPICAIYAWGFGLHNIGGLLLLILAVFYFGAVLAAPFFQSFACPNCTHKTRVTYFTRTVRCGKCGMVHLLDES
jgi:hypothetical protein